MKFLPALLAAAAALVASVWAYDEFPEEELETPGMSRWVTPADVPTPVYPPGSITTLGVTDPSDFNLTVDYLNAVPLSNPVPQEIKEIVRGLGSEPALHSKRIFEYVRNHYDFQPYFGLMKGAEKTHLDRAGNDADLCSLLAVMLTEAGYAPQFVEGWMTIPAEDLAKWTKADQSLPYNDVSDPVAWQSNTQAVLTAFGQGGIYYNPAAEWAGDKIAFKVHRTLVRVQIGGTTYLLDPAFKAYRRIEGSLTPASLKTAMGYDRTALLNAIGGTSVAHNGRENMDEAGVRSLLTAC